MEIGEEVCPVCLGDGWRDWPILPCPSCEGSGFAGPVVYLKPDDRPGMYRQASPLATALASVRADRPWLRFAAIQMVGQAGYRTI